MIEWKSTASIASLFEANLQIYIIVQREQTQHLKQVSKAMISLTPKVVKYVSS
jgi:hypothetical protein